MAKKKPDTGTFTNAADEKALEEVRRIEAAGGDPFGDDDDEATAQAAATAAAAAEKDDEKDEGVEAADGAEDDVDDPDTEKDENAADEPPPAQAAAVEEQQDELPPVRFNTPTREELDAKREELLAAKDKAFTDFDEGTITREDFLKQSRAFDNDLMGLAANAALLEATEQARVASQEQKLEAIKAQAKKDATIDYDDDEAAATEFNAALRFVGSVPSNAKLNFSALADKAHAIVLAQRGVAAPKPAADPTPATPETPSLRKPPAAPITLAGLPAASTPNSNGGVDEQLSRLHGQDFEAAISAMPKAKRDAWMDS